MVSRLSCVLFATAALLITFLPASSNAQSNNSQALVAERVGKALASFYQSLSKQNILSIIRKLPLEVLTNPSIGNCLRDFGSLTNDERRSCKFANLMG